MATKYRKPTVEGKIYTHETQPKGTHVVGTPDPGAIPTTKAFSTPDAERQAITGTPGNPKKATAMPQKGRSTSKGSATKGLEGTPNG